MSYYEVLGVGRDASREEIRRAYLDAVKLTHPDKMTDLISTHQEGNSTFITIQRAWEVLRDQMSRECYDAQLDFIEDTAMTVYDSLDLDEMERIHVDGELEWMCQCRCGDCIAIKEQELSVLRSSFSSILLPCRSCSLCLEVRMH